MNPNGSKKIREIGKETRFTGRTAAEASKKAHAAATERKTFREIANANIDDEQKAKLILAVLKRAQAGNLKAFELIRDTMGEKPADKVIVSGVSRETIDEVERLVTGSDYDT